MNTTDTKTADVKTCKCGCGRAVTGNYRPGHDAKHVSVLIAELWSNPQWRSPETGDVATAAAMTMTAYRNLPSVPLQVKFNNALARKIETEWTRFCNLTSKGREAHCVFGWHPDEFWAEVKVDRDPKPSPEQTPATPASEPQEQAETPEISADGGEVKVGRWTYPTGSRPGQDTTYRNSKRDGSGDWIEIN